MLPQAVKEVVKEVLNTASVSSGRRREDARRDRAAWTTSAAGATTAGTTTTRTTTARATATGARETGGAGAEAREASAGLGTSGGGGNGAELSVLTLLDGGGLPEGGEEGDDGCGCELHCGVCKGMV